MTQRIRRYALTALAVSFLACGASNWITTIHELQRFYTNLPIWDALDFLTHYARYKHFDLSVLWIQHNEHRIIGTEILYAIDMLFFHGRQIVTTLVSVAAYVGVLIVLIAFAFHETTDHWTMVCAALLAAAIAGYKICVVSLTIPFLACWTTCEFLAIAAIAAISVNKGRGGQLPLWLGIGCAIGATYSVASGMFVWPVLLLCALLTRMTKAAVIALALSGAASIALYFFHYTNLHTFQPGVFLGFPLYGLKFLGSFLGMPFSAAYGMTDPPLAVLCGWSAIVIGAADLVLIIRKNLFGEPTVLVLGGFCILILISATATAMGRMNPEDPLLLASRAGRYITEPMLFWCSLVLITVWLIQPFWNGFLALVFMFAIAFFAFIALPKTADYYAWWEAYFQRGQWAAIALANGITDTKVNQILYTDPGYVSQFKYVLADNHLAVFADREPAWIGRYSKDLFSSGPDGQFHGAVTSIKKLGLDFEVQGWADGPSTFVFVDGTGRVIGFGKQPPAGPAELYTLDVPRDLAFTGFIRNGSGAKAFSIYALDRNERYMFRLGQLQIELPQ